MLLWLILSLMTFAVALYVAAPFVWPLDKTGTDKSSELGIYRDQLAEIDREAALGTIEPAAAAQARAEIQRRLLAADKLAAGTPPARPLTALEYRFALITITAVTVLGSAILYAFNGAPGVASATPGADATAAATATSGAPSAQVASVEEMNAKLALQLKANPNNAHGWEQLGWSYMMLGKLTEAVDSYRKSVAVDPKVVSAQVGLANSIIQLNGGKVSPEASGIVAQALKLNPKAPEAMFLEGLAKSQAGDNAGALDEWLAVLALANRDDPWAPVVREKIIALAKDAKIDITARLPAITPGAGMSSQTAPGATPASAPAGASEAMAAGGAGPAAPAAAAGPAIPGPTQADIAAAQALPPADRLAMIQGMVAKLAARLEVSPRDIQGWMQLMRSRKILGDIDGAKDALKRSLDVFADSPPDIATLKAAGSELGLPS